MWEQERYDYTVSPINDYCRSIIEQYIYDWPEGLRWMHYEDSSS